MSKIKWIIVILIQFLILGNQYFIQNGYAVESPENEWMKKFGGNFSDKAFEVQQTIDGGYVVIGETLSYGAGKQDVWLIKTDYQGNEEWNKTYGDKRFDTGNSVEQTSDGGYIIVGTTASYGVGSYDVWLIKTDTNGKEEWTKTFGDIYTDTGSFVQQTTDGGYIIAGSKGDSTGKRYVWVIKTDANGFILWDKIFDEALLFSSSSIQQTIDGGYILVGSNHLLKIDINGYVTYNQSYYNGNFVQQTSDGGYIITGSTQESHNWFLSKVDYNLDLIWMKIFFDGDILGEGFSVQQTSDGGYILAGTSSINVTVIKTDGNGTVIWHKIFDDEDMIFYSVKQTIDSGYILAGASGHHVESDICLVKLNSEEGHNTSNDLDSNVDQNGNSEPDGVNIEGNTPGFELFYVICIVVLILFFKQRRT